MDEIDEKIEEYATPDVKINDLLQALIDFNAGQAENRRVCVDIFSTAHIGVKTGAQFDQARDAPFDRAANKVRLLDFRAAFTALVDNRQTAP